MSGKAVDFVVITALQVERDSVLRYLGDHEMVSEPGEPYTFYVGSVRGRNGSQYRVAVSMSAKPGNVESALTTEKMISKCSPQKVLMVGIAGGLANQGVHLGDVVVADCVHYYESSKRLEGREELRPQQYQCDPVLIAKARSIDVDKWRSCVAGMPDGPTKSTVRFGPILSGEKVIADPQTIDVLLKACPKALAVAMEGTGVAVAAGKCGIGFLEIRGVSDFADAGKNDDWHQAAADAASAFLFELIEFEPICPLRQRSKDGSMSPEDGPAVVEAPKDELLDGVNRAFKPRAPIQDAESFQGRTKERKAVVQAIATPGSHVFIYGDRGVGKTSLANVCTMGFATIPVFCEQSATFSVICRSIMRGLDDLNIGTFRRDPVRKTVSYSGREFPEDGIRVDDLLGVLPVETPLCIVLDELDRVKDKATVDSVAELVKALATLRTNVTVILVSVAETVEEIIGGHASNTRCFEQIRVNMMPNEDMRAIISHGETVLGVRFDPSAQERMLSISCRFPFYLHLIGHEASLQVLRAGRKQIGLEDIDQTLASVATRCDQSLRSAYAKATRGESRLGEWVIRSVADHEPMIIDVRTATRLVGSYARESGADEPRPQDVGSMLLRLTKPDRGTILRVATVGKYRFADPRMKGYVRLYRASDNGQDSTTSS